MTQVKLIKNPTIFFFSRAHDKPDQNTVPLATVTVIHVLIIPPDVGIKEEKKLTPIGLSSKV